MYINDVIRSEMPENLSEFSKLMFLQTFAPGKPITAASFSLNFSDLSLINEAIHDNPEPVLELLSKTLMERGANRDPNLEEWNTDEFIITVSETSNRKYFITIPYFSPLFKTALEVVNVVDPHFIVENPNPPVLTFSIKGTGSGLKSVTSLDHFKAESEISGFTANIPADFNLGSEIYSKYYNVLASDGSEVVHYHRTKTAVASVAIESIDVGNERLKLPKKLPEYPLATGNNQLHAILYFEPAGGLTLQDMNPLNISSMSRERKEGIAKKMWLYLTMNEYYRDNMMDIIVTPDGGHDLNILSESKFYWRFVQAFLSASFEKIFRDSQVEAFELHKKLPIRHEQNSDIAFNQHDFEEASDKILKRDPNVRESQITFDEIFFYKFEQLISFYNNCELKESMILAYEVGYFALNLFQSHNPRAQSIFRNMVIGLERSSLLLKEVFEYLPYEFIDGFLSDIFHIYDLGKIELGNLENILKAVSEIKPLDRGKLLELTDIVSRKSSGISVLQFDELIADYYADEEIVNKLLAPRQLFDNPRADDFLFEAFQAFKTDLNRVPNLFGIVALKNIPIEDSELEEIVSTSNLPLESIELLFDYSDSRSIGMCFKILEKENLELKTISKLMTRVSTLLAYDIQIDDHLLDGILKRVNSINLDKAEIHNEPHDVNIFKLMRERLKNCIAETR